MSMLCPQCQAENPEDKKYCGDCGASLDPHIEPIYKYVNDLTRQQVRQEVQERFRDQTLVEIETSQAIATRLGNWAKLFAYFVGIPFAMFIVVLGIFGVRSFTDFLTMVETAQSNISAKLEAVENATLQADELLAQTDRLKGQVEEVERLAADMEQMRAQAKEVGESLQEIAALSERFEGLASKVTRIEEELFQLKFLTVISDQPGLFDGLADFLCRMEVRCHLLAQASSQESLRPDQTSYWLGRTPPHLGVSYTGKPEENLRKIQSGWNGGWQRAF